MLVVFTFFGPVGCHDLPPSVERKRPLFVPSTRRFGSDGATIIVQYHAAYGTADADPAAPTVTGLDFETAPSAKNAATKAATRAIGSRRLRVSKAVVQIEVVNRLEADLRVGQCLCHLGLVLPLERDRDAAVRAHLAGPGHESHGETGALQHPLRPHRV